MGCGSLTVDFYGSGITVDVLARRMAAGGPAAEGGADLSVYDGFLKGGGAHAC